MNLPVGWKYKCVRSLYKLNAGEDDFLQCLSDPLLLDELFQFFHAGALQRSTNDDGVVPECDKYVRTLKVLERHLLLVDWPHPPEIAILARTCQFRSQT